MPITGLNRSDCLPSLGLLSTMFRKADLADSERFLEMCRFVVRDLTETESASLPRADWQRLIDWMVDDPFLQERIYRVLEMILI
jgi:hypothetical protein